MHDFDELPLSESFQWKAWRWLLKYLRPFRKSFVWMLLMLVFCALFDAIYPYFQRYAINVFIEGGTDEGVWLFGGLFALAALLQSVSTYIFCRIAIVIEMNLGRDLRDDCFGHLQRLSLSFYNRTPVGYIMARVMSDTNRLGSLFSWELTHLAWSAFYVVLALVSMLLLDAKLFLLVLLSLPVFFLISAYFQKRILLRSREVRRANSRITGSFNENITGAKTIKTLVLEEQVCREFDGLNREMYTAAVRVQLLESIFLPLVIFCGAGLLGIVLAAGGKTVTLGGMDVGTLSVFITYTLTIFEPIQNIVKILTNMVSLQANVERIDSLLTAKPDIIDRPDVVEKYGDAFHPKPENWEPIGGDIEFKDVTFRYPDGDTDVLSHFNLKIPAGSMVAIVGETGAGKSTLVNLACRFFEPTEGQVLIDGRDARDRSQLWLHRSIGYVLQQPHLFSGSIRENIRYGKLDATDQEIEAAAKTVFAHDFILAQEKGYDTDVGEGGDRLSTGQKQLISLARAVVADPRIFVLDEATSSVDTDTEQLIQTAIAGILRGRTSFVVAHRLSTVKTADVILVVHDGRIVEQGTHRQLICQRGVYYGLYARQFEDEAQSDVFEALEEA